MYPPRNIFPNVLLNTMLDFLNQQTLSSSSKKTKNNLSKDNYRALHEVKTTKLNC